MTPVITSMDPGSVYSVVQQIPRGKVTSYGHVALLANYPNNARQVGQLLKHLSHKPSAEYNMDNVPWQRVINSRGEVPSRPGSDAHIKVLRREVDIDDCGRVDLSEFGWFPETLSDLE